MADLQLPYYKHYARDALADTRLAVLTLEQQGALSRLADHFWVDGGLPDDPAKLARLLRISEERFAEEVWPGIAEFFVADGDGLLQHEDLALEREALMARRRRQVEDGRRGARKRWGLGNAVGYADRQADEEPDTPTNGDPNGHPSGDPTGHPNGHPTKSDGEPNAVPIASSDGRGQMAEGGHLGEVGSCPPDAEGSLQGERFGVAR